MSVDDDTTVVLGIGNVLWADEGFGVRCVEALQQRWDFAPHVQLIDGGTQGLYLIQFVQAPARQAQHPRRLGLRQGHRCEVVATQEVPRVPRRAGRHTGRWCALPRR